ncbi:MAG: glucokinase, partial [Beijerinckiaceae bacterium]
MIPHPVLLCDAGGAFTRFAYVLSPGQPVEPLRRMRTNDFRNLADAARQALEDASFGEESIEPVAMVACIAGPVHGRLSCLTNGRWQVDGDELADQLGLDSGLLLNDFEALALGLPANEPDWTMPVGPVPFADPGETRSVQIVAGPGNGLGCAALVATGRRFLATASEAGHMSFGPGSRDEERLWPFLAGVGNSISAETVLSAPGLERLHRARILANGGLPPNTDAEGIAARALSDPGSEAAATVRLFWRMMARFAGDLALAFMAHGGITLAGGLLPKIAPLLDPGEFRRIFESKYPMEKLLARIPVRLLMREDAQMH